MAIEDLQASFGIPGLAEFKRHANGLIFIELRTGQATATLQLQGAHLSLWQPAGERPVLFLSRKAVIEPGKPLRGGMPICFPWFGPHPTDPGQPAHGVVRQHDWEIEAVEHDAGGGALVRLAFPPPALQAAGVSPRVELRYRLRIGATLEAILEVTNRSDVAFQFEEALHPYFAIGGIDDVSVTGIEGAVYVDKVDGLRRKRQGAAPLRFAGETDRTYLDTTGTCRIVDPAWQRTIVIEKQASASTVIWNPWAGRARGMGDLDADEWRDFVCVETANAMDNRIALQPGGTHRLLARYSVERNR